MTGRGDERWMRARQRRLALLAAASSGRGTTPWFIGRALVAAAATVMTTVCLVAGEGQGAGEKPPGRPLPPGPGILVAGDGAAETYAHCIACHSERLVAQQGLTRQGWEEVIELMMEEHGMAPIKSPNLERVLGYLSTHYGPDRPNFPMQ